LRSLPVEDKDMRHNRLWKSEFIFGPRRPLEHWAEGLATRRRSSFGRSSGIMSSELSAFREKPTLAKSARIGHPEFMLTFQKVGHPPPSATVRKSTFG
jgi:hypothetical protein